MLPLLRTHTQTPKLQLDDDLVKGWKVCFFLGSLNPQSTPGVGRIRMSSARTISTGVVACRPVLRAAMVTKVGFVSTSDIRGGDSPLFRERDIHCSEVMVFDVFREGNVVHYPLQAEIDKVTSPPYGLQICSWKRSKFWINCA